MPSTECAKYARLTTDRPPPLMVGYRVELEQSEEPPIGWVASAQPATHPAEHIVTEYTTNVIF